MTTYRLIETRIYEFEADSEEQARESLMREETLPVGALRSRSLDAVITDPGDGSRGDVDGEATQRSPVNDRADHSAAPELALLTRIR